MKAKTAIWVSQDGRSCTIRDMELGHLQNLAAFLQRRGLDHDLLQKTARDAGFIIGPKIVQGHPIIEWFMCCMNELGRRRTIEVREAEAKLKVLRPLNFNASGIEP